jgi:hypothetical protein
MTIRPFREQSILKRTTPVLAIFICLYLGFILPLHHHSDGHDHDNCSLCIVQDQSSKSETVFTLNFFATIFNAVFLAVVVSRVFSPSPVYRTRAPPALTSAF